MFDVFGSGKAREAQAAQQQALDTLSFKSSIVDGIPTPVVAIGRDFKIQHLNDAAASLVGRSAESCVGMSCYEVFRTEHCRTAECRVAQSIESGATTVGETVASPNGSPLPIRYTASPMRDAEGQVTGAVEFILDISDEVRIAETMQDFAGLTLEGFLDERAPADDFEGNNRAVVEGLNQILGSLAGHLNAMPSPAVIVDKDFTVRFMNEVAAGVAGFSTEEVKGRKCFDLFKADDCGTEKCALGRAMRTGQTATSETAAHPQGMDLQISYSGVPLRGASGEIIGAMEIITDQTSLRRAMSDSNEKVEYLNAVPTPVLVVDREFTVKFINPAGAGVVGRTTDECIGLKCFNMFNTGDCKSSAGCAVARAMRTDSVVTSDTIAQLPSGPLPIRYTGRALKDESGQVIGALEYVLDISKEMEITDELTMLAQAAIDGRLDTRADADKFEGNYQKIVAGVNETVQAILEPVTEAAAILEQVAQRKLDVRVEGDYRGDHAALKNNINLAIDNLDVALTQVAEATEQVTSASGQISAGAQSLAEGTNEQASSLEEVSSSLEEMAAMTSQNADSAADAKALSEAARASGEEANTVMVKMSEAMDRIKSSSDETAKIIKTIDEIAFQTNLLALNAAVEAARAGEAGKGFAVVAEEVRNLAQRSAEAAKVTANMIEESQRNADGGVKTAKEVGDILGQIVIGSTKVNEITAEIAAASNEQAKGIDQLNDAVAQMSKVTQQNASNSEESAGAAEELTSQAEGLKNMVFTFALTGGSITRNSAPAAPAPMTNQRPMYSAPSFEQQPVSDSGNGNGHANARAVAIQTRPVRPEEVIPLDDAELNDF